MDVYKTLFKNMLDGFAYFELVVNGQGEPVDYIFKEVNTAYEAITGLQGHEIINHKASEVLPELISGKQHGIETYGRVALNQEEIQFEHYLASQDKWLRISAYSPKPGFFATLIYDITARKRSEVEIVALNDHLQRQTNELSSINKELEAFSYSVSHDLRSPLRSINGFSQAIIEDYYDVLDDTGKDYLQRIQKASVRLDELIDDMLKLSRLTRSDMNYTIVDLSQLASSIAEELHEGEANRKVKFDIQSGIVAHGDVRLIRVVLANLIGNSWKFTSKLQQAIISFGQIEKNGEQVFYVRDNGAGLDMKYAGKLFSAFQRLHDAKDFPGNGIGLATVQRVINRHGGRVWVESEINQGSAFYFTLSLGQNKGVK